MRGAVGVTGLETQAHVMQDSNNSAGALQIALQIVARMNPKERAALLVALGSGPVK